MKKFFNSILKIEYLLVLITFGIIIYLMNPLVNMMYLAHESLFMPYMSFSPIIHVDSPFQVFTSSDHSWFIHSAFYVLTNRYLPELLNMHPQESIILISNTWFLCIFLFLITALTESFYKFFKIKNLYSVLLFFVFITLLNIILDPDFVWFFQNDCWYYAYVFMPIFALVLYNDVQHFYITDKKLSKRELFVTFGLFLCVALSHEYYRFVLMGTLLISYILDKIVFRKIPSLQTLFKHVLIFVGLIFCNLLTCLTSIYKVWFESHYYEYTIATFFDYLEDYWVLFKQNVILDNIFFYISIILAVILISLFVKNKQSNKKLFITILSTIFSIFIFFFAILIGKDDYDSALVQHVGLLFLTKLLLFNISLSCYGYLISHLKLKYRRCLFCFIIVFVLVFSYLFLFKNKSLRVVKQYEESSHSNKKLIYVWEKSFFLINKKKKKNQKYNYYYVDGSELPVSENSYIYLAEFLDLDENQMRKKQVCSKKDSLDKCINKMIKQTKKDTGYTFTKQELKELDFEELYDDYY